MRKRYCIVVPALAMLTTACLAGDEPERPPMPISVVREFEDTLAWGVTNEAVDSIHGFEINVERPFLDFFVPRVSNVWETDDTEFGLLELESVAGLRVFAFKWWGLVPSDICKRVRSVSRVTGHLYVRVFRYYGANFSWYNKDEAGPDDEPEGRWIGDQSSPLYDKTWPINCTPNEDIGEG